MASANGSVAVVPGRDIVKVNNASLSELKNACDDALKRYLSRPELFNQIYTHTDVRLALGWLSVFVAGGTGLYGWKVEFEESKPIVWAGVLLYVALTLAQTAYAYFVERDTVFVGKRKTLDKRIVTERLTISSSTDSSAPKPKTPGPVPGPLYALDTTLVRTSGAGAKTTLLGRTTHTQTRPYAQFFDKEGVMDVDAFEAWLSEVVAKVVA